MNIVMRVCLNADLRTRFVDMLRDLGWLNVTNMFRFELCVNMRRIMWYRNAPYTFWLIVYKSQHDHMTRRQDLRMIWLKNNQHGRNSFVMTGVRVYNDLGLNPRWFKDFDEFKQDVKLEIIHRNGNGNL